MLILSPSPSNGLSDDTAQIQAAIDSGADAVCLTAGTYTVSKRILLSGLTSVRIFGDTVAGYSAAAHIKIVWAGNSSDPLFHLLGSRDCSLENLTVSATASQPLHDAIRIETLSGKVSTGHRFRNLIIDGTNGGITNGIEWVVGSAGDANNDAMLFDNVRVTNYAGKAWDIEGTQCAAHVFLDCSFTGNSTGQYGVYGNGGQFYWYGGGGGGNSVVDFYLVGTNNPVYIGGCQSESSAKFLLTGNFPGSNCPVVLDSCTFNTSSLGGDNRVIDYEMSGPLTLLNFAALGSTSTAAVIHFDPGTNTNYQFLVLGGVIDTSLANPFDVKSPTGCVGFLVIGSAKVPFGPYFNQIQLAETTVAALPAASTSLKGQLMAVSDASSPTWGSVLTGGGSTHCLAYCTGTNWVAH